ncbi:MAG: hypothetical protein ACODAJ_03405 [Planctomycetota bacterium]
MRAVSMVTAALVLAASVAGLAGAQEERPDRRGPGMRGMRFDFRAMRARAQAAEEFGELLADIPAVQEELTRHREALMGVLQAHLSLAGEMDAALRELRQAGADEAEREEAAKVFEPQAKALAAKRAAALATHYANLAKILNPEDKAQREEVHGQLAEAILQRMATGGDEGRRGPGRFPGVFRRIGGFGQGGPRGRDRGDAPERRGGGDF